jgi:acetyl esterase/lipase
MRPGSRPAIVSRIAELDDEVAGRNGEVSMASPELTVVVDALRANPPVQGSDIEAMRAGMLAATTAISPPADVEYEPVDANGVPAEWARAPGARADRAVLYLHGGGYVLGSIATHRGLVAAISRAAGARVLSLDYRLGPEHPHPAAVDDALCAYRFLLANGAAPERVAIAGDSAGGGLSVATLVALRDAGDPLPAAGVCISPWLDLTLSGASMDTKADVDPMVDRAALQLMADAYLAGADPMLPTASPLFADLGGLPPLLVQVGTAETLLDDSRRLADRAKSADVDLVLEEWDEMIHVWHAFAVLLPEGRQAIDRIGEYLDERLS